MIWVEKKHLLFKTRLNIFHFLFHFPFPSPKRVGNDFVSLGGHINLSKGVTWCAGCAPPGVTFVAVPFSIFFSVFFSLAVVARPGQIKITTDRAKLIVRHPRQDPRWRRWQKGQNKCVTNQLSWQVTVWRSPSGGGAGGVFRLFRCDTEHAMHF